MKSKINKKILAIILILTIWVPMLSYANNSLKPKEEAFLKCEQKEAVKGEKVVLSLNLELIDYEKFEFILSSNKSLNNISTNQENVNITNENDNFKMIANKSDLNIKQIDLYYQVPEEIEIGTKIELKGTIKEYKDEVAENEEEIEGNLKQNETQEEVNVQEVTIIITVVEEQKENEKQESSQNSLRNEMVQSDTKNNQNMSGKTSSNLQMQIKNTSSNIEQNKEINTYKGESNNYLQNLEITNLNITPQFTKTNTTYFINVENDVTKIDINAEAEDENAKVNIYGNDNLKEGENKILISVTAENGDVKIYRIYVTK